MTRITIRIEAALLCQIKQKAAVEGRTLQDVTNDLLRQALYGRSRGQFSLQLHGWDAKQQPGVDLLAREKLFALMERW